MNKNNYAMNNQSERKTKCTSSMGINLQRKDDIMLIFGIFNLYYML